MSDLPTWEVVARGRQLMWRICWAGLCVEAINSTEAQAELSALCRRHGIRPPVYGLSLPERGPSEVDEPGV
jgi:hypothetical protein